jgi:hypothetical protein
MALPSRPAKSGWHGTFSYIQKDPGCPAGVLLLESSIRTSVRTVA